MGGWRGVITRPTRAKLVAYLATSERAPVPAEGRGAPDHLAVAVGGLWVIRDAADAALARVSGAKASKGRR